jgi:hypothetical protein
METERVMCLASMIVAGLLTLIFLLDLALGVPFSRASLALDILIPIGGAFVLWQGYDTYRELA